MYYTTIFDTSKRSKFSLSVLKANVQDPLNAIKTGHYTNPETGEYFNLISLTKKAREIIIQYGKDSVEYSDHKLKFPAFIPNGYYLSDGVFTDKNFSVTGLVYIDLDDQDGLDDILKGIPSLFTYWRSTSGKGYSVLFQVSNYEKDDIPNVIKAICTEYGLTNCKRAMKKAQPCIMPFDPELFQATDVNSSDLVSEIGGTEQLYIQFDFSLFRDKYSVNEIGGTEQLIIKKEKDRVVQSPLNDSNTKWSYAKNQTKGEWRNPKPYIIYDQPIDVIDLYPRYINIGNRNKALLCIAAKCIALYHAEAGYSREETYKRFARYNNFCQEPLSDERIQYIFNSLWKQYEAGNLQVQTRKKYGEVDPNLPLAVDKDTPKIMSKRKAAGMLSGEVRNNRSLEDIRVGIDKLKSEGKKITKKSLADAIGKKPDSIKKKWQPFKTEIEKHNKELKKKPAKNKHSKASNKPEVQTPEPAQTEQQEPVKQPDQDTADESWETAQDPEITGLTESAEDKKWHAIKALFAEPAAQPVQDIEPAQPTPSIFDNYQDLGEWDSRLLFVAKDNIKIYLNNRGNITAVLQLMDIETVDITHLKNDEQRIRNFNVDEFFQQLDQQVVQEDEQVVVDVSVKERIEGIQALLRNEFVENREQDLEPVEGINDPVQELEKKTQEERTELVFQYLKTKPLSVVTL